MLRRRRTMRTANARLARLSAASWCGVRVSRIALNASRLAVLCSAAAVRVWCPRRGGRMVGVSLNEVAISARRPRHRRAAGALARHWRGAGLPHRRHAARPEHDRLVFSDYKAQEILHFAEFGVVLLLFLIGLELRPKRLWAMRNAVFGLGSAQVLLTGAARGASACWSASPGRQRSSPAWRCRCRRPPSPCRCWRRRGDLATRHGRLGFAVLLFQDLAAIPLIAFAPLFATTAAWRRPTPMDSSRCSRASA